MILGLNYYYFISKISIKFAKIIVNVQKNKVLCDNADVTTSFDSESRTLTVGGFDWYSDVQVIENLYG